MTTAEKIELALIPIGGGIAWSLAAGLPDRLGVGKVLLSASLLLLIQSLVRDLWLLAKHKRGVTRSAPRKARCLCVESIVGVTGVVTGIMVLGSGIDRVTIMHKWSWSVWAMATMAVGFTIKDYVMEWAPFRIRREADHLNIIVTWKRE